MTRFADDAAQTEMALDGIMLKARQGSFRFSFGDEGPAQYGARLWARFDGLFPRLAAKHGALFYPFFLDGVAADAGLNQADGIHPNA